MSSHLCRATCYRKLTVVPRSSSYVTGVRVSGYTVRTLRAARSCLGFRIRALPIHERHTFTQILETRHVLLPHKSTHASCESTEEVERRLSDFRLDFQTFGRPPIHGVILWEEKIRTLRSSLTKPVPLQHAEHRDIGRAEGEALVIVPPCYAVRLLRQINSLISSEPPRESVCSTSSPPS